MKKQKLVKTQKSFHLYRIVTKQFNNKINLFDFQFI